MLRERVPLLVPNVLRDLGEACGWKGRPMQARMKVRMEWPARGFHQLSLDRVR